MNQNNVNSVWVDGRKREMKQRHCIVQLDDCGRTVQEFRIPFQRSPWTQNFVEINEFLYHVASRSIAKVIVGLEIITENFVPLPALTVNQQIEPKYREWIETNVLDTGEGLCLEWAGLMCQVFPELELVSGLVFPKGRTREGDGHYWCKSPDGAIVDPTAHQFHPSSLYRRDPHKQPPKGFCEICGAVTYENNKRCSVYCYNSEEVWDERRQWEKPEDRFFGYRRSESPGTTCSHHQGHCRHTCE